MFEANISDLWHSKDPVAWEQALQRYWSFVQPRNLDLEQALHSLDVKRLQHLTAQSWYDLLHDEYFRWKYTAPNRYATTTNQLKQYISDGALGELDSIRQQILNLNPNEVRRALKIALKIHGLGTAGASGLLSLIYPEHFATVDQFVVKALRQVSNLPEAATLANMNPQNLTVTDGVVLISILNRKSIEINQQFAATKWTPRKIDMILWTYGRE